MSKPSELAAQRPHPVAHGREGATNPASSFDFTTGRNVSNGFTSALGTGGLRTIAPVAASTRYHLVIDIAAYIT